MSQTLRTSRFQEFTTSFGHVAWVPESLGYVALPEPHASAARSLHSRSGNRTEFLADLEKVDSGLSAEELLDDLQDAGIVFNGSPGEPVSETSLRARIAGYRISLTENCNFTCEGCFSTTALRNIGATLRTMDRSTLERVMRDHVLPTAALRPTEVHFFGGEPLLRFNLMKEAMVRGESRVRDGSLRFSLTTNGSIFKEEIASVFVDYNVALGMSIELNQVIHDRTRRDLRDRETWDRVRENYLRYRDRGVDCHILITPFPPLPESGVADLEALMDELGLTTMTINTPFDEDTLEWLGAEEHLRFLIAAHEIADVRGVELDSALSPILGAISNGEARKSPQSTIGDEIMVGVTPDGELVRSTHKFDRRFIADTGPENTIEVPLLHTDECRSCPAADVCGGPNEEFVELTAKALDAEKCVFHVQALRLIAENLQLFQSPSQTTDG